MKWDVLKWVYESKMPPTINSGAHAVLVALAYSMHPTTKRCNPSIQRLSRLTLLKPTAIKTALRKLKAANLISLSSGKYKRVSNSYVIHYSVIPPKTTGSESGHINHMESARNSELIPPTNQINTIIHGFEVSGGPSSSSSLEHGDGKEMSEEPLTEKRTKKTAAPAETPKEPLSFDAIPIHSRKRDKVPCGIKYAEGVVMEYFEKNNWFNDSPESWERTKSSLEEFLAFHPCPTVELVGMVHNALTDQGDFDVLHATTDALEEKRENNDNIRDWGNYALSALKRNLADRTNGWGQ